MWNTQTLQLFLFYGKIWMAKHFQLFKYIIKDDSKVKLTYSKSWRLLCYLINLKYSWHSAMVIQSKQDYVFCALGLFSYFSPFFIINNMQASPFFFFFQNRDVTICFKKITQWLFISFMMYLYFMYSILQTNSSLY